MSERCDLIFATRHLNTKRVSRALIVIKAFIVTARTRPGSTWRHQLTDRQTERTDVYCAALLSSHQINTNTAV